MNWAIIIRVAQAGCVSSLPRTLSERMNTANTSGKGDFCECLRFGLDEIFDTASSFSGCMGILPASAKVYLIHKADCMGGLWGKFTFEYREFRN